VFPATDSEEDGDVGTALGIAGLGVFSILRHRRPNLAPLPALCSSHVQRLWEAQLPVRAGLRLRPGLRLLAASDATAS
jgi:hypothetical protein